MGLVSGLVLAAGAGRRFGGPKALVTIGGERLVDRAVRVARQGGCAEVVVVSGAAPLEVSGARVVHNPGWRTGMGSSLRTGLAALRDDVDVDVAVIMLVDTPGVGPEAVRRVAAVAGSGIAVATYGGERGHPVALARSVWPAAAELAVGDTGARGLMQAHPELVVEVQCDGTGEPRDIDVPDDLPS